MAFFDIAADLFKRFTGTQSPLRRAMDPIITALGLTPLTNGDEGLLLAVRWDGEDYALFVCSIDGVTAQIAVHSRFQFLPHRLPPEVCMALEEMNKRLPECEYEAFHGRDYSQFGVNTLVPLTALTVPVFRRVLGTLMGPILELDAMLIRRGYAR